MSMNRQANALNRFQGDTKKVLCVCSAGLLRSPTAAVVLSQEPFNYNTRAVGVEPEYALFCVEPVHIFWADQIVCMEQWHADCILAIDKSAEDKIKVLNIPDNFEYRNPELMELISSRFWAQN